MEVARIKLVSLWRWICFSIILTCFCLIADWWFQSSTVFPKIHPTCDDDPNEHRPSSSGVYRDKLKPLLDSTDAGHLLSIFSYTGEGACIEHVDRGFITLVTKSQERRMMCHCLR